MKRFIKYLNEEFDQTPLAPLAIKWLKNKFGDNNEFIHKPNLSDGANKRFDASIEGKTFTITGRKHKTKLEDSGDTIIFKIEPDEQELENDDEF